MSDNERELADELLRHRDDQGEWDEEAESLDVRQGRKEVVSFRIPSEELDSLEREAGRAGETMSEFIRKSLALRLHGQPIGPAVEISSGADRLTIRSHIVTTSRSDAPGSFVPDLPPLTVAQTG